MKLYHILFLTFLLVLSSCKVNNEKTDPEPKLSKIITELKELGEFESAEYELFGNPNKRISHQNTIKVTFSNSTLTALNVDEFGENSARKIYNLNVETRNLETIWICVLINHSDNATNKKAVSNENLSVSMNVTKRNLIFKASELQ